MNESFPVNATLASNLIENIDRLHKEIYSHKILSEGIEIENANEYTGIAVELSNIKRLGKELKVKEAELLAPFSSVINSVKDKNKEYYDIALSIEKNIKTAMLTWDDRQEQIKRDEEERIHREEAERVAKEKLKLEKKIDKAELKGDSVKVEELQSQADSIIPIIANVEKDTPKVDSIRYSYRYDFKITDENAIPRKYLKVDEILIRKVVVALKEQTDIPGIEVIKNKIIGSK